MFRKSLHLTILFMIALLTLSTGCTAQDGKNIMEQNKFGLNGTWVQAEPSHYTYNNKPDPSSYTIQPNPSYTIKIDNNRIIIRFHNKMICDTIFELDGTELKNTQKRRNWQDYVEGHQYEHFGHFESIEYNNNLIEAIIFVADRGIYYLPFIRH
jgi:hypothetical protein